MQQFEQLIQVAVEVSCCVDFKRRHSYGNLYLLSVAVFERFAEQMRQALIGFKGQRGPRVYAFNAPVDGVTEHLYGFSFVWRQAFQTERQRRYLPVQPAEL